MLAILLVLVEFLGAAIIAYNTIAGGFWWLLAMLAYASWLVYISNMKRALLAVGNAYLLALSYIVGGILGVVITFVVLLMLAEIFVRKKDVE